MSQKTGKVDTPLLLRLIGATLSSVGFYLVAYNKQVLGAIFIGIGGVLIALGGST